MRMKSLLVVCSTIIEETKIYKLKSLAALFLKDIFTKIGSICSGYFRQCFSFVPKTYHNLHPAIASFPLHIVSLLHLQRVPTAIGAFFFKRLVYLTVFKELLHRYAAGYATSVVPRDVHIIVRGVIEHIIFGT